MRLFASGFAERFIGSAYPDDLPLESKLVTRTIEGAQSKIEDRNVEIRKNVLKYDDVLTEQRKGVYHERREILEGEDVEPTIEEWVDQVVVNIARGASGGAANGVRAWGAKTLNPGSRNGSTRSSSASCAARRWAAPTTGIWTTCGANCARCSPSPSRPRK